MSGWKVGDKFLLKVEDGGRYRTEWYVITGMSAGGTVKMAKQSGSLLVAFDDAFLYEHAIPFDDAIVNLEQGLGQYTDQYEKPPLMPLSSLAIGVEVALQGGVCKYADYLINGGGPFLVVGIDERDKSMSLELCNSRGRELWVDNLAVDGVKFNA